MPTKAKIEILFLFIALMASLFILYIKLNKEEVPVVRDTRLEYQYLDALRRIDSLEIQVDKDQEIFESLTNKLEEQKGKNKQIKTRRNEKINSVDTLSGGELYKLFTKLGRKK